MALMTKSGARWPGSKVQGCSSLCSRILRVTSRLFLIKKRGTRVMTLVSLYLPKPTVHDNPIWCSWLLFVSERVVNSVSADGASRLID
jgi:hypothetical protein